MSDAERGFVYKLFAYYGGPLVLDAVTSGLDSTTLPQHGDDIEGWFNNALRQIVRTSAAAAAARFSSISGTCCKC